MIEHGRTRILMGGSGDRQRIAVQVLMGRCHHRLLTMIGMILSVSTPLFFRPCVAYLSAHDDIGTQKRGLCLGLCGRNSHICTTPIMRLRGGRVGTDTPQLRLFKAVERGDVDEIEDALRQGADVGGPDPLGAMAIHMAR